MKALQTHTHTCTLIHQRSWASFHGWEQCISQDAHDPGEAGREGWPFRRLSQQRSAGLDFSGSALRAGVLQSSNRADRKFHLTARPRSSSSGGCGLELEPGNILGDPPRPRGARDPGRQGGSHGPGRQLGWGTARAVPQSPQPGHGREACWEAGSPAAGRNE